MMVGRLGSMGSLFFMQVVLARSWSHDKQDYSAYLAAASVVPLLSMLATLGTPWTLVRILRSEVHDPLGKRQVLRATVLLSLIGSVISSSLFFLAIRLLPSEPKWQVLHDYPWMVCAWCSMSALCMITASYLQAEDSFLAAALVGARSGGVIPNVLALAMVAIAAGLGMLQLHDALAFQLLAYAVAIAVSFRYIRRGLSGWQGNATSACEAARPRTIGWFFSESWPNLLNQLIGVALNEVDLFWIACWANENTVADYGVVRNLRLLVTAPLMVASIALPPFVAELHGKRDFARLERLLRGSATVIAIPSIAGMLVLLLAPKLTLQFIYGNSFTEAATALQLVAVGSIIFVLSGSNAMTLTMTGRHRDLLVCSLASLVLYALISPPLVLRWGVTGAAAAFALQTAIMNVVVTIRVRQVVGVWTIPLASWSAARDELTRLVQRLKSRQ
jgi:O-antigen/teichoic acid export membrane protein